MKKSNEKLFIVLFSISLLVNIRQCSDSQYHEEDFEALEYEVMELESTVIKINRENIKLQKVNKPVLEIKEVKKFKPRIKASEPVDSVKIFDSIPAIQKIDSTTVN